MRPNHLVPLGPGGGFVVERGGAGTFRTDDGGLTWRSLQVPRTTNHGAIAGDGSLLVRAGLELERSLDGGATWSVAAGVGPEWALTTVLLLVPDGPLLALDYQRAWRSDDLGDSWSSLDVGWPGFTIAPSLAASRDMAGDLVLLAGLADGVLRWDEATGAWMDAGAGLEPCNIGQVLISPDGIEAGAWARSQPISCAAGRTVFRTRDGGASWTDLESFELGYLSVLAVHPSVPEQLLAGGQGGVRRSRDGGDTWESVLEIEDEHFMVVAFGDDDVLVAGSRSRLWWSDDDGVTWRDVSSGLDGGQVEYFDIGAPEGGAEPVLARSYQDGWSRVVRQFGSEGAWRTITMPDADAGSPAAIGAHPTEPGTFITSAGPWDLYRTTDAGARWEGPMSVGAGVPPNLIQHDLAEPDVVLALDWGLSRLLRSEDAGLGWIEVPGFEDRVVAWIARDRANPGRWVMSSFDRSTRELGLHVSEDGGASWDESLAPPPPVGAAASWVVHADGDRLLVVVQGAPGVPLAPRLWLHEPGTGWTPAETGLPVERPEWWQGLAIESDPSDPQALVLATSGLGLWRSRDGGASWTSWNLGAEASALQPIWNGLRHRRDGTTDTTEYLLGTSNGIWSLTVDDSDLVLRVSRSGDDVVLGWPDPALPVTVLRSRDPTDPQRAIGPATLERTARDPVATDGRLYFYRARY
ncbi:MAG: hypothetical protein AAF533_24430 [Acidobacteriota bacterium]